MKKKEKLMKIGFKTKTAYGDDVKSKKTKIKTYKNSVTTNFHKKMYLKKYWKKKYHIYVYQ